MVVNGFMGKSLRLVPPIMLTLILWVTGCSAGYQPLVKVGERAPDFQLQNLEGETISLSDFRGKPVLINFWATWCPPCRVEMPYLQQIYDEWSEKGLVLLAIDLAESPAKIGDFLRTNNLSLPVLLDTDMNVSRRYNVSPIPTTFFVDRNGIIQSKVIGAFPNKEAIEEHLAQMFP